MAKECVVVTGASGYIGSHIVANLLLKGKKVRATVRDSQDQERVLHLKDMKISEGGSLEIVEMDLFDEGSVDRAIYGATYVIHTAAMWLLHCKDFPRTAFNVNIEGTFNVLEACVKHNIKKLIYSQI